jgi:hypothetical protein
MPTFYTVTKANRQAGTKHAGDGRLIGKIRHPHTVDWAARPTWMPEVSVCAPASRLVFFNSESPIQRTKLRRTKSFEFFFKQSPLPFTFTGDLFSYFIFIWSILS